MQSSILGSTLVFLLICGIRAMKPAPFEKEYTFEAPSGVKLVSTQGADYGSDPTTTVYGPDGSMLYDMPVFTGRRGISLSPDGSGVVLDGNYYFGTRLMRPSPSEGDQIVTSVYRDGQPWKDILYESDLQGGPVPVQFGGGWSRRTFTLDVNWERNFLIYHMDDGSEDREISLSDGDQKIFRSDYEVAGEI